MLQPAEVSILVFLELALRLEYVISSLCKELKFQSLFSWNSLFDTTVFPGSPTSIPVSILVFLELALRLCYEHLFVRCAMWFQSLFSWNSLFDRRDRSRRSCFGRSFNPCFPGTRSSTQSQGEWKHSIQEVSILVFLELALRLWETPAGVKIYLREFQSLFSWNSLFDHIGKQLNESEEACFNPCFPGTRSST